MIRYPILIVLILILLGGFFVFFIFNSPNISNVAINNQETEKMVKDSVPTPSDQKTNEPTTKNQDLKYFPPIDNFKERVTKKSFGDYITPQTSPVQPEKFKGYHTGVDFEIFSGEENKEIEIFALCDGNVVEKKYVNGYGGVLILNCKIEGTSATVLYGHLKLESIKKGKGEKLVKGEMIGILGKGFSLETSGERKHLHLGIHKGTKIDYRGYVQQKSELKDWIDPLQLLTD